MKKFLVAIWLACLSVPACGMDPVQYIVDHSPELQQFQAQSRWYNQISVKATTRGRYGQPALLSEDDAALESSGNQTRSTFDFTISATLPLICPREALDNQDQRPSWPGAPPGLRRILPGAQGLRKLQGGIRISPPRGRKRSVETGRAPASVSGG